MRLPARLTFWPAFLTRDKRQHSNGAKTLGREGRHSRCGLAYSGAVLWVSTFQGLGYFLGDRWRSVERNIHHYAVEATVAAAILVAVWMVWRWWKKKRRG